MSTYTPGPWVTYAHTKGIDIIVDDGADGKSIATARSEDDAALIAAAPDLLIALRALLRDCERLGFEGRKTAAVKQQARAAINKAKGEQP